MARPPYPFTLRQLQYAAAVAETLSFRKAAELCRVSQPALSGQLAELEGALGVTLFERDPRRVLVTSAGRELLKRVEALLLDADDVVAAAQRAGDPMSGTLRIGIIPTVSPYLLPSVTPALRAAFPRLSVVWTEEKTNTLVEALEGGILDAALLALDSKVGEFERELIAKDAFVLAAPVGHPLGALSGPMLAKDLRDVDVLLLEDGHCFREQALAFCSRARARELEFRATSLSTLAQMVAGGAGVTLLPRLAVETEARRAELTVRPFAEPPPHRTLGLVWRRGAPMSPALRAIASTMREAYPDGSRVTPVRAPRERRAARS